MLTSMTGYASISSSSKKGKLLVEIQSVNRKFLETNVYAPKEFFGLETEIKRWIAQKKYRGQIVVKITIEPEDQNLAFFLPDSKILASLKKGWEILAKKTGIDPQTITLPFLVKQLENMPKTLSSEEWKGPLFQALSKCIEKLLVMQRNEGKSLSTDMQNRIKMIQTNLKEIQQRGPKIVLRHKEKLEKALKEACLLKKDSKENYQALLKEITFFGEKIDITEEITRLQSHLSQFLQLLSGSEPEVGRKMDFLLQEMIREINTIAAKSPDVNIARNVVVIKSELEKIREQAQNIE
jgi:uncharacterized protein (TIGR00255 family)